MAAKLPSMLAFLISCLNLELFVFVADDKRERRSDNQPSHWIVGSFPPKPFLQLSVSQHTYKGQTCCL